MKVLVFGSGGFIGSAIADFLSKNHEVFRASFSGSHDSLAVDLMDSKSISSCLLSINPDVVINCAGIIENSEKAKLNIKMTNNILDVIVDNGVNIQRIIILGSASEYGEVEERDLPVSESHNIAPISEYASAKAAEINQAIDFSSNNSIPLTVLRLFNPIGKNMNKRLLLPAIINQIQELKQKKREFIEVDRLDARRDYVSVKDVARAVELILFNNPKDIVYNVGSGVSTSNKQLIEMLLQQYGIPKNAIIKETQTVSEPLMAVQANIDRLRKEFGWEPSVNLKEIITEAINE